MKPTDILREEHELILVMLEIVDEACKKISAGEKARPEHLESMIDFIRNFADRCHHAKEENLLFPAMEKAGIAREGGPIGVMLAEHAQGREYVKGMDGALGRYRQGSRTAGASFVDNAMGYIGLLGSHITKENNILFVMADQQLSADQQDDLMKGFERVEREEIGEGVHERYHELLHRLRDIFITVK